MILDSLRLNKLRYKSNKQLPNLGIIFLIWLISAICDRFWYNLDRSVPGWDQADYLNGALNYAHALQTPQWFNGEWWRSFWLLSNKIPPLHYILTAPFLNWFGKEEDVAILVMLLYSAMLLVAVYGLGVVLFNIKVGIYAAILCQLLPGLYYYRLEFLLDYPLTAIVIFSFWLLTLWQVNKSKSWLLAIAFGLSLGLALLLKQTALFFLLIPITWLLISYLKERQWLRITQLVTAIFVSITVCYPWYRTNWLLILTSGKRATIDSAIAEGDPALNTLDAWLYYFKTLPYLLSWHLLLIPVVGLLLYFLSKSFKISLSVTSSLYLNSNAIKWLIVYLTGGYLLSSFNINKDARYILPLLPVIALFLAIGLLAYTRRWRNYLQWLTISLAFILMLLNMFPLPGKAIAKSLSPRVQHYPYLESYPHQEIIKEIIQTEPYLRTTLGVLPSTPAINQHNFSFYGGQQNFKIVGRQVGVRENEIVQDARSLFWFITKTGDQGSVPETQATINQLVTQSNNFKLQNSWQLPNNSQVKLYRATQPNVEVNIADKKPYLATKIQLNKIEIPQKAPRGQAVPVKYQWLGNWQQLAPGIVLLTWKNKNSSWIHDHGIAMGMLESNNLNYSNDNQIFQVTENTAMLVPKNTQPGRYKLEATYLNRQTKASYNIPIPETTIIIEPNIKPQPAPELDLVTQLRTISPNMASGITALEPIFAQTARINQYDGKQDYLKQTEIALSYRLQNNQITKQQKIDWSYAVALSQVLQQDVKSAITSFQNITNLEPNNPYGYAYLAFVYLYDWHPQLAEKALNKAETINPNIPEITTLQGVAALMQGNFIKAWKLLT